MKKVLLAFALALSCSLARGGEVKISSGPAASRAGEKTRISFAVSGRTDVEVSILDSSGKPVRHLAAGVLGGEKAPEAPLKKGLSQEIIWDGKDDFGKTAKGAPFKVRLRAGMGVKFGRMLGQNDYAMGKVTGIASDSEGNVFMLTLGSGTGRFKQVVMLDSAGKYVRTLLPFPANLPPERVKNWAWSDKQGLHPRNRNSLGPEFYTGASLTLLSNADAKGVLLTDGKQLYRIAFDGGNVEGKFVHGRMWPAKKGLNNSAKAPTFLKPSPDGKYLYLSGPFSAASFYGHKYDPQYPPAQVYRMEMGKGGMQPWVRLDTAMKKPYRGKGGGPRPPITDVAIDSKGNVLVANPEKNQVVVFSEAGKQVGKFSVNSPQWLAIHPKNGAVYVASVKKLGYAKVSKVLRKFSGWKNAKEQAKLDLGVDRYSLSGMTLAAGKKSTLWVSGLRGGMVCVSDAGGKLAVADNLSGKGRGLVLSNVDRMAVDAEADLVYVSNAWSAYYRFDGRTGKGERLSFEGKGATDVAVGRDGHVYAQLGPKYSGPLCRYTRDMKPAPYAALKTHVMSGYIYGRYHGMGGNCEKGMGVSTDGRLYVYWMFGGWVRYAITQWGPNGKVVNGKYAPVDPNHAGKGTPPELRQAVIGPLPGAGGGVCVDSKGRIYVGVGMDPVGHKPPKGYEKDYAYERSTGSVVRFGHGGGAWGKTKCKTVTAVALKKGTKGGNGKSPKFFMKAAPKPEGALQMNGDNYMVGANQAYAGFAPMSGRHADTGTCSNPGFCHCRVPRFGVDLCDRLYIPNAITNRVRVLDSAGNLVCEFGAYGNYESQGPGAKSPIKTPAIPLGWPTGAGASDAHIYVGDMYNRRVVRADKTWAAEKTASVK